MSGRSPLLTGPVLDHNPITVQVLGVCSALAVTTSLSTSLVMGAALTAVLASASASVSLIRRHVPNSIRLILQITLIASLVIVVDMLLQTFAYAMSERLSVFVGLIVTNCIVLGRSEAFAMRNPPLASLLDGVGNGLGYALVLALVGSARELLGTGGLLGYPLWAAAGAFETHGGSFPTIEFMLMPASAFFLLALLVWAVRARRPAQIEAREFGLRVGPCAPRNGAPP